MMVFGDWGTTNLRVWLVDNRGKVKKRYTSNKGFKKAAKIGFSSVLKIVLTEIKVPKTTPVWLSGMVGAKQGWQEAPYCQTPTSIDDIANNVYVLESRPNTFIIGGVNTKNNGEYDVIRGEEVQLVGIMSGYPDAKQVCLPGTHSKWVRISEEKIRRIDTFMTGELFDIICNHSILNGQIKTKTFDEKAFKAGIQLSKEPVPLTKQLFKIRTNCLFEKWSGNQTYSVLSGLLIGQELRQHDFNKGEPVYLCGSDSLMSLYQKALKIEGIQSIITNSEEVIIMGYMEIYKRNTK